MTPLSMPVTETSDGIPIMYDKPVKVNMAKARIQQKIRIAILIDRFSIQLYHQPYSDKKDCELLAQ